MSRASQSAHGRRLAVELVRHHTSDMVLDEGAAGCPDAWDAHTGVRRRRSQGHPPPGGGPWDRPQRPYFGTERRMSFGTERKLFARTPPPPGALARRGPCARR